VNVVFRILSLCIICTTTKIDTASFIVAGHAIMNGGSIKDVKLKFLNLGIALGIFCAIALQWQGGFDCLWFFCRPYHSGTTIPAFGHILLFPLTFLSFPYSWMMVVFITLSSIFFVHTVLRLSDWYLTVALLSPITWMELWLGQIEFLYMLGVALIVLDEEKRKSDWWTGVAILLLSVKPQMSWLLLVFVVWWIYKDGRNVGVVFIPLVLAGLLSFCFYGWWIPDWLRAIPNVYGWSAIYPYGFLALPLAWLPTNRRNKIFLTLLVSLVVNPHVLMYHSVLIALFIPFGHVVSLMLFVFKALDLSIIIPLACLLVFGIICLKTPYLLNIAHKLGIDIYK